MRNPIVITLLLFTSCFAQLVAQTIDEFELKQQKALEQSQKALSVGTSKLENNYTEYASKRDREWSDYLRKEWEAHQVLTGEKLPQKPKPDKIPTYTPPKTIVAPQPDTQPTPPTIVPIILPDVVKIPLPQPVLPICKPIEPEVNAQNVQLNYYGRLLTISYDHAIEKVPFSTVNQEAITAYWEGVSSTNYTPIVEKLMQVKKEMNLNDYAFFELVEQFSKQLFPSANNQARLLSWFIMVRAGYGVRVAFHADEVALLVPFQQQMYQVSYMTLDGKCYYIFPKLAGGSYFTYDRDYSTNAQPLSLNLVQPIHFNDKKAKKELNFDFEEQHYKLELAYDPDLIEFYKAYPQAEISIHFNAASSSQARQSIADALKPYTSKMDELKAVNFLLHFVQTAFEYKTDEDQFGREKFFFAEELLYYPYSDCEDRAVLFSYLVRELIGLKVIGLKYPNHIATAVALSNTPAGDYLTYKNKSYVVSDPTYIDAPVGLTMPQFKNVSPIVVEME
jgi:hypothetical protein